MSMLNILLALSKLIFTNPNQTLNTSLPYCLPVELNQQHKKVTNKSSCSFDIIA